MPDRTTKVTLTAVISGYIAGMDAAQRKTAEFAAGSTQKLAAQRQAMTMVGTAALAIGAAAAAGVALSIKAFADFDAKMAQVQTLSHATADDMDKLRDAALHMGQAIGFSATQVADAETELVKAGVSVKDIMGGALKGALELAAAGQIDVGKATEIATIALTQFGLKGKDVPHVADLLAAGADKALGGVGDLGEALKSGGLVAAQFGVSLDETVGTLAAFANAGLLGETAGTGLRQMLLKLSNPSADASKTMKQLGISVYDTSGNFVGMAGLAGQLQAKMKDLDPATRNAALATIFGSRAIQAANVLYKEGAKGVSDWTTNVNDSGFAAQQARGKMDNLKGDISKLGAAFTTNLIEAGSTANDVLRGTVQTVTNLTSAFGELPKPVQGGVLAVGAIVAVVGLVGGTVMAAIPKFLAFRNSVRDLSLSMKGVSLAGGAVALAITGIVTVLSLVANAQAAATAKAKDYEDTLDSVTGKVTKSTREMAAAALDTKASFLWMQGDSVLDMAKKLGVGLDLVTNAALGNSDAMKELQSQIGFAGVSIDEMRARAKASGMSLEEYQSAVAQVIGGAKDEKNAIGAAKDAHDKKKEATDADTGSTDAQAAALEALSGKATSATTDISKLADTIKGFGSAQLDVNSAERDFQAAIDDATKSVHDNGTSLDISTAAGRSNQASLDAIAQKSLAAAAAIVTQTGNQDDATAAVQAGRDALIKQLAQYGITGKAAEDYANSLGLIPKDVATVVTINTDPAQAALDAWLKANSSHKVHIATSFSGGQVAGAASGGTVTGVGTSKSDSNLYALSVGEEVIQEPYATRYRPVLKQMNAGAFPGYANGGTAGFSPAPVYTSAPPRQYMQSPSMQQRPSGPMQISGVLDMGNGLKGFVKGMISDAFDADGQAMERGYSGI